MKLFNRNNQITAKCIGSDITVCINETVELMSLIEFKAVVTTLLSLGWSTTKEDEKILNSLCGNDDPRQQCLQLALNL